MGYWKYFVTFAMLPSVVQASDLYSLEQLEDLARSSNPALQVARQDASIAHGGVAAARALPNPTVDYVAGPMTYRPGISGTSGTSSTLGITQPIDLPFTRTPRIAAAKAGLAAAQAGYRAYEADWIAGLRLAYHDLLRRTAEQANADENVKLVQSIQSKIALSVKQGETAKFELIRTQAELLNVQKIAQSAALRVTQAREQLRLLVGASLPADFAVAPAYHAPPAPPPLDELVEQVVRANPALAQSRALREQARQRLAQEQSYRLPSLALRAERSSDAEQRQIRVGLSMTLPLWDRRKGPVESAQAELSKADLALDSREYTIRQDLGIAYKQYEIAQNQVAALENGVVNQAEAAVKVAEAAYRFGERGLIDVLDAQRVYRAARADLIASRYDLAAAWVEIRRIATHVDRDIP